MRPVEKGSWPVDEKGVKKIFKHHSSAREDLENRIGEYCSYCEIIKKSSLAVEHVKPQSLNPELTLNWDNFLLACTNCNSIKGHKSIDLGNYYWPHKDNTLMFFDYFDDGRVELSSGLSKLQVQKSQAMLDLVGLQRYPDKSDRKDKRWLNRRYAFKLAKKYKGYSASNKNKKVRKDFIECLIDIATNTGFFSIWYNVFRGEDDVINALIDRFPGTHRGSFDETNHYAPIERLPGSELLSSKKKVEAPTQDKIPILVIFIIFVLVFGLIWVLFL